ncbi:hypothetical protein LINPERPRIM_LOCUS14955 [Linum perenne]
MAAAIAVAQGHPTEGGN